MRFLIFGSHINDSKENQTVLIFLKYKSKKLDLGRSLRIRVELEKCVNYLFFIDVSLGTLLKTQTGLIRSHPLNLGDNEPKNKLDDNF